MEVERRVDVCSYLNVWRELDMWTGECTQFHLSLAPKQATLVSSILCFLTICLWHTWKEFWNFRISLLFLHPRHVWCYRKLYNNAICTKGHITGTRQRSLSLAGARVVSRYVVKDRERACGVGAHRGRNAALAPPPPRHTSAKRTIATTQTLFLQRLALNIALVTPCFDW